MKKLRRFWRNIPRKVKILLNFLLVLVLGFWVWLLLGAPAGIEQIYRRIEKANLVGPGEILSVQENPGYDYEYLLLADAGELVTAYFHDEEDPRRTHFVSRERSQGMALLTFPADNVPWPAQTALPVFLFDGYDGARRAELVLSLPDGSARTEALSAPREENGYFRFLLPEAACDTEIVDRLRLLSGNTMADRRQFSLRAEIRLWDEEDVLLKEVAITLN